MSSASFNILFMFTGLKFLFCVLSYMHLLILVLWNRKPVSVPPFHTYVGRLGSCPHQPASHWTRMRTRLEYSQGTKILARLECHLDCPAHCLPRHMLH